MKKNVKKLWQTINSNVNRKTIDGAFYRHIHTDAATVG